LGDLLVISTLPQVFSYLHRFCEVSKLPISFNKNDCLAIGIFSACNPDKFWGLWITPGNRHRLLGFGSHVIARDPAVNLLTINLSLEALRWDEQI